MYEFINKVPLKVKEYKGNRVVTLKDIDTVHSRSEGTAHRNFKANRKYFIEGEDYFKVCADEIRLHKIMDISPKAHGDIILLTESGYLMLAKSLTDDLSWEVQRQLVNIYFRAKEVTSSYNDVLLQVIENQKVLGQKIDALEKKVDAIEKQSSGLAKDVVDAIIEPCFKRLDSQIESTSEKFNRSIIRSVTENVKLLGTYIDILIKK